MCRCLHHSSIYALHCLWNNNRRLSLILYSPCRWEVDDSYCESKIISKPESEFYEGLLEYTDSSIFDFLMGKPVIIFSTICRLVFIILCGLIGVLKYARPFLC